VALPKVSLALAVACVLAAAAPRVPSAQHITIDGRFSPAGPLPGPNYTIGANLGKQVGSNLFHSFGQFSLYNAPVPESATFTSTGSNGPISNVIGRVTGGNQSSINGKIQSTITGANLYLINPSGIVFGPHATVSVSGSFHASTADYVKMADGARFQATQPDGSTLSAAPPAAFGFLTASPAKISVNGSMLSAPSRQTLGLVSGPVSITGGSLRAPAGAIHVTSAAAIGEVPVDPRNKPALTVRKFGAVDITGGSKLDVSDPSGLRSGGSVFIRSGALMIDASEINADNNGSDPGGKLLLRGDDQLALSNGSYVHSLARANGSGAAVILHSATGGTLSADNSIIAVGSNGAGNAGKLVVRGDHVLLTNGAQLTSTTVSAGSGGAIVIKANNLLIDSGAGVTSDTEGNGDGGSVMVRAGSVLLDTSPPLDPTTMLFLPMGIFSGTSGAGRGGSISITASQLTLRDGSAVLAQSSGAGAGGDIAVTVGGQLTVDSGASLGTLAFADKNAGDVSITATGPIIIDMSVGASTAILGGIGSLTGGSGKAGNVTLNAGALTIGNFGVVGSVSVAAGNSGDTSVNVSGTLSIIGKPVVGAQQPATGITGDAFPLPGGPPSTGNAGKVYVTAGNLSIVNNGEISSSASGSGNAGGVAVTVSQRLTIDGTGANPDNSFTGIQAKASAGTAGTVTVVAGKLAITTNGEISGSTSGIGNAGDIVVTVSDQLIIDGTRKNPNSTTGIASQVNTTGTGSAGTIRVSAGNLSIVNAGEISTGTLGQGNGGSISVSVAGGLTLDGAGITARSDGSGDAGSITVSTGRILMNNAAGISATTSARGAGGNVAVTAANSIAVGGGSLITSRALGSGSAGAVEVTAQGPLTLTDPGTGIAANSTASGDAGQVRVSAPQITLMTGAKIASTTAGTGGGGSVDVTTPGALVLDGAATQIAASATGEQSGAGGPVTVMAGSLTVMGGAQIASSTAGPDSGGPVTVKVASDIVLPDPGPQITAQSTGSGDAGSITLSAVRLLMSNGSAISTQASTADGGNITLNVADLVYLLSSKITASVNTQTGNGGNVTIDPQLVVLNHSSITATAAEGRGGNIRINAGAFISSADSIVDASSQKGISGTVLITNPRVDVNGALVVLSSELRGHAAVLREACAARADRPVSSLVEAGRGGLPQDPEATLPALYIADRDVNTNPGPGVGTNGTGDAPLRTTVRLTMPCR
jgi:filamentous hemagglutinin family protein